jgi:transposase
MAVREVIIGSKRYTEKFKVEAVRQVVEHGHSVAEVASRLGMTTHSLYAWKMKYGPDSAEHQEKTATEIENRRRIVRGARF